MQHLLIFLIPISIATREREASDKTCVIKTSANSESIHPSVVQWTNEFPKARFRSDSYSILVSQLQAVTARTNDFSIKNSFALLWHPRQPKPQNHHPFRENISSANHDDDDGIKLYSKFSHFLLSKQRQSDELWGWKIAEYQAMFWRPAFRQPIVGVDASSGVGKLISGKVLNHHSHSHHAIHEIIRFSLRSPVPPHLNRNLDGIQIDYFNSFKLIIKGIDYSIWDSRSIHTLCLR